MLSTVSPNHSSSTSSRHQINLLKRKVTANTLVAPNMQGILPIDTYKKDVDELITVGLEHDWEGLRASILESGLRTQHCLLRCHRRAVPLCQTQQMESSSPRDYLSVKKSKKGPLKQVVPQYQSLKNNYTLLWDMPDNTGYINVVAVMQKFFDQAISGNWSYNPTNYPDNEVPVSVMANDFLSHISTVGKLLTIKTPTTTRTMR